MIYAICAGIWAFLFSEVLTSRGEILFAYRRLIRALTVKDSPQPGKIREGFYKILVDCPLCMSFYWWLIFGYFVFFHRVDFIIVDYVAGFPVAMLVSYFLARQKHMNKL